jgi:hypothetical protein
MRPFHGLLLGLMVLVATVPARAAEPEALIQARTLYNEGNYDAAILAAADARAEPEFADAAAVVLARAHLERFRLVWDPADLTAAHDALSAVTAIHLSPRDYVDLLVGFGQHLFLTDAFGAARELFDSALAWGDLLSGRDRLLLLDWWANALDRSAQARPADARAPVFRELVAGMDEELRRDPGNPVANYWLPVAARGAGDIERAWEASKAGWVRARLDPSGTDTVRADLDRFVVEAVIPGLALARGGRTPEDTRNEARQEWERFKAAWP